MTAQEYLSQYLDAIREERRLERLIARTQDRLDIIGLTMKRDKIQTSRPDDKTTELLAQLIDLKDELAERKIQSVIIQRQVELVIAQVPDAVQRDLLSRHYVEGLPWRDVAYVMSYHYRSIFKIHAKALVAVEEIINA